MKKKTKHLVAVLLAVIMMLGVVASASAAAYTVKKGDSLWAIANEQLGSGLKWKELFEANKDKIKDPNKIYVGQILDIPGSGSAVAPVDPEPVNPPVDPTPAEPDPAPEGDFTVTWTDAVLAVDIIASCELSGEEEWTLRYTTSFGDYALAGVYFEEADGTYGVECLDDSGLGMWFDSAWSNIQPALSKALNAHMASLAPAPAPEGDFTVTWTDAVLAVDIIASCELSGEEEWTLRYTTSFGDYALAGVYFEEADGAYGVECLDDSGLGMWFDSAWANIQPALSKALNAYLTPSEADFTVSWTDAVLGTDITAGCILSGEEDWSLDYETAFGFYSLSGVWFKEADGTYGVECIDDGGLGMWFDSAWVDIQPALSKALTAHFSGSASVEPEPQPEPEPEPEVYTVTFVYNMGSFENETTQVEPGKRLAAAVSNAFQDATKYVRGYSFDTWYLDEACTKEYKRTAVIEGDTVLYGGWKAWSEDEAALYNAWLDEFELQRDVYYSRSAYTKESFQKLADVSFNRWNQISSASWEYVNEMRAAREALVKVREAEDVRWYIWGDNMPSEDTSGYHYFLTQDGEFFRPSLNAYLHEDQSTVKGNIIICSGGGYAQRSETMEAWPTADVLYSLGYNCYVLNYRISPNNTIDASIDLQRAIRYVKYHAEEYGIGAIDNIATVGYSAGGLTVMGQLTQLYGNITPDSIYPSYVCDEIDRVNCDYKVTAPIYGYYESSWDNYPNEHMPAVFNAIGTEDGLYSSYIKGAAKVAGMTDRTVLYEYKGAPHGFGMGTGDGTSDTSNLYAAMIPIHFDAFLTEQFGVSASIVELWADAVTQYTHHAEDLLASVGG